MKNNFANIINNRKNAIFNFVWSRIEFHEAEAEKQLDMSSLFSVIFELIDWVNLTDPTDQEIDDMVVIIMNNYGADAPKGEEWIQFVRNLIWDKWEMDVILD